MTPSAAFFWRQPFPPLLRRSPPSHYAVVTPPLLPPTLTPTLQRRLRRRLIYILYYIFSISGGGIISRVRVRARIEAAKPPHTLLKRDRDVSDDQPAQPYAPTPPELLVGRFRSLWRIAGSQPAPKSRPAAAFQPPKPPQPSKFAPPSHPPRPARESPRPQTSYAACRSLRRQPQSRPAPEADSRRPAQKPPEKKPPPPPLTFFAPL